MRNLVPYSTHRVSAGVFKVAELHSAGALNQQVVVKSTYTLDPSLFSTVSRVLQEPLTADQCGNKSRL